MTMEEREYIDTKLPAVIDQLKMIQECIFNGLEIDVYLYRTLHLTIDTLEYIENILKE